MKTKPTGEVKSNEAYEEYKSKWQFFNQDFDDWLLQTLKAKDQALAEREREVMMEVMKECEEADTQYEVYAGVEAVAKKYGIDLTPPTEPEEEKPLQDGTGGGHGIGENILVIEVQKKHSHIKTNKGAWCQDCQEYVDECTDNSPTVGNVPDPLLEDDKALEAIAEEEAINR